MLTIAHSNGHHTSSVPEPQHIAIVLEGCGGAQFELLTGVQSYAAEHADWLLHIEDDPWKGLPYLPHSRCTGVIACVRDQELANALLHLGIPLVFIELTQPRGRTRIVEAAPGVTSDDLAIGGIGAQHLLSQSFPRYAFVGCTDCQSEGSALRRSEAFQARIIEAGFPCELAWFPSPSVRNWSMVQAELTQWLEGLLRPVAIMASDDHCARYLLDICYRLQVSVPTEVAVLGVGNEGNLCQLCRPQLSSVEHLRRTLAYRAADMLGHLLRQPHLMENTQQLVAPTGVAIRQSTDCLHAQSEEVAMALRFIREHANQPIQVSDVVRAASTSRATLKRKFQALIGRSISEEIKRVRLACAQELLQSTRLPMKLLARRAGFRSPEYLGTVFRQAFGISPKEYREQFEDQGRNGVVDAPTVPERE